MAGGFNNRPSIGQRALDNVVGGNAGGIISTRPSAKYASGARCVLKINGKLVGFAFGISWRCTTMYTEINTIDDVTPVELAPQKISVEGTISALHIPGESATASLWQPDMLSFLFHKYIVIEVRDSQTDQLLFHTGKAVITSKMEDIRVDQLASVTLNFRAIGWVDEKTPAPSNNYNKSEADIKSAASKGDPSIKMGPMSDYGNRTFPGDNTG